MRRAVMCLMLALGLGAIVRADTGPELVRAVTAQLPAFMLKAGPTVFDATNLWDHINGDADRILAYRFQWAVTGLLEQRATGRRVTLDLYRFASPLDAFGAHSMDRSPAGSADGLALPGGTAPLAAYLGVDQLRLWRGGTAVIITPLRRGTPQPELALEVGRAVARVLPPHTGLPPLLRVCPPTGLLVPSLRYQRANVFGRSELGEAALASYGMPSPAGRPDVRCDLAVFDAGSLTGAGALRERLAGMLADGGACEPAPELGEGLVTATHPRFGWAWLGAAGRMVVLVYHGRDESTATRVLREALERAGQ